MKFIAAILFFVTTTVATAQPVQPQFPNTCSGEGYAVLNPQNNTTNSNLFSISPSGTYTLIGPTNVPSLNGIGMDSRLNKRYIWGMNSGSLIANSIPANLYRIGSDGSSVAWGSIAPPAGGLARGVLAFAGDINPLTGTYYVPAVVINSAFPLTYTFYLGTFNTDVVPFGGVVTPAYTAINLGNCSAAVSTFMNAYALYVANGAIPGTEPSGLFQDLALNPAGNTIYGFMGVENVLMTISVPGGTANCINADPTNASNGYTGCTGATSCEIGGMFFDAIGALYAVQVDRGITYKVNTTTGQLTVLSSGQFPADSRGDVTRCASISIIPTPVSLISFTATTIDCNVSLKWTTAQEINNDRFEIESSQDGINFQKITTAKSKGPNSSIKLDYSALISLLPGTSFLRLKQIDIDGKITYSQIITATTSCAGAWNKNIKVYPTVLQSDILTLKFYTDKVSRMNFSLYAMDGKLMQQQQHAKPAGTNTEEIKVTNISAGIYLLKVQSDDGTIFTTKITKK